MESQYVICVKNEGYSASLELRKLYRRIPNQYAERHGQLRIVDESGEDYFYPEEYFVVVQLPEEADGYLPGSA